ncbi:voltage-gated potassium channel [Bacillus ectoiniformans]|uniref:potassium channel protein n=1 Tax=Bacillus ectoiniformans TaxID=1494429 RepID=UPI001956A9CD|nr:potassium channel protein [Bacillus ectoiniformans]MBM7650143.1 voltage-gated potassium channel [Bacillus ectoiniformans]
MHFFLKLLGTVQKIGFGFLFLLVVGGVAVSSVIMKWLEPETFPSLLDSVWYVMTTITTVGYGDYYPVSTAGRVFAVSLLYLVGIGVLGVVIGKIVQVFSFYQRLKEEGKLAYHKKGHYIFIGWSEEKTKEAVVSILNEYPKAEIVLIDTMNKTPYEHDRFHYIQGDLTEEETLKQANIQECNRISIFSPSEVLDSTLADGHTLLIASSIEAYGEKHGVNLHIVAEMRKENHRASFEKANIEDIVLSTQSIAKMMAKATVIDGANQLFFQLLNDQAGEDLREIPTCKLWATYGEANEWLESKGANLISDRGDLSIIRKKHEPIPPSACLLVACNDESYAEICKELNRKTS